MAREIANRRSKRRQLGVTRLVLRWEQRIDQHAFAGGLQTQKLVEYERLGQPREALQHVEDGFD
jgi:hypothetical protein